MPTLYYIKPIEPNMKAFYMFGESREIADKDKALYKALSYLHFGISSYCNHVMWYILGSPMDHIWPFSGNFKAAVIDMGFHDKGKFSS